MPQSQQAFVGTVAAALIVGVSTALYLWSKQQQKEEQEQQKRQNDAATKASLSKIARRGSQIKPPFPTVVREMLSKCRLAYLSTVDVGAASSHLSLMRFTYLNDAEDGEVVILSTNKKTKKFDMLQSQKGVALLVHDFGQGSSSEGLYTITLNGNCRIIDEATKAEHYRKAHLSNNPDYPQFIVGEDIAILCVDVTSARICDINDQVTKWKVGDEDPNMNR